MGALGRVSTPTTAQSWYQSWPQSWPQSWSLSWHEHKYAPKYALKCAQAFDLFLLALYDSFVGFILACTATAAVRPVARRRAWAWGFGDRVPVGADMPRISDDR